MVNLANENRQKIANLQIGMSYSEVTTLMGSKTVYTISNPMRSEAFTSAQGKNVQVLYYCTMMGVFGQCYERNVTPVVLENGRISGWGRNHLGSLSRGASRPNPVVETPAETTPAATTPAIPAPAAPASEKAQSPTSTPTIRR